jgi:hypothetical protein
VTLPLFGSDNARAGVRRLELQVGGEYQAESDGAGETSLEAGVVWAPIRSVLFRVRHAVSTERPSREFVAGTDRIVGESLIDPRRGGETIADVQAVTRGAAIAETEESERTSFGMTS